MIYRHHTKLYFTATIGGSLALVVTHWSRSRKLLHSGSSYKAQDTRARNRRHKPAPVFQLRFLAPVFRSRCVWNEKPAPKINMAELSDEFGIAYAVIIAGMAEIKKKAKKKKKRTLWIDPTVAREKTRSWCLSRFGSRAAYDGPASIQEFCKDELGFISGTSAQDSTNDPETRYCNEAMHITRGEAVRYVALSRHRLALLPIFDSLDGSISVCLQSLTMSFVSNCMTTDFNLYCCKYFTNISCVTDSKF